MRILFLSCLFPPRAGGAAVVYDHLCKYLNDEVTVLAPRTGAAADAAYDQEQDFVVFRSRFLQIVRVKMPLKWLRICLNIFINCVVLRIVAAIVILFHLRRVKPDVVCLGSLESLHWALPLIRGASRARIVFYVHGDGLFPLQAAGFVSRWFFRRVVASLRAADGVVGVSKYTVEQLIELGVPTHRVKLIYNGVDHKRFTPGARDVGILARHGLAEKRVILTVARLDARKGHATIIRAMPAILRRVPKTAYLIVGDGPQREFLGELVESLNLQAHVVFAGSVADNELCSYYRSCDVFAQPNRQMPDGDTEGFGLVFLEAGACGKPVVGGNAGGVREAVVNGKTGILVDGQSEEETADAISSVLLDAELSSKLAGNGLSRARIFNWEATGEAFRGFCRQLTDTGNKPAHLRSSAMATRAVANEFCQHLND